MKRALLILSLLAFALLAPAQVIKFMGIPVDGPLSAFQAKLQQKGFRYDPVSKGLKAEVRAFNGIFAGEKVNLYVHYDAKTKKVHGVSISFEACTKTQAYAQFERYKNVLNEKYYAEAASVSDEHKDEHPGYCLYFGEPQGELYGMIIINVCEYDYDYYVSMDYINYKNYNKAESNKNADF